MQKYSGIVVKGNGLGKEFGFRTANLVVNNPLDICFGVYVANIDYQGTRYNAIANYGIKPTIGGKNPLIEIHIFDFDKDIYGKEISVCLNEFLRKEQKFGSFEELKTQIKKDIEEAKKYF